MAYGQSESADIKKIEIRALSKFDDVLLFEDIRIRNPTMQILKGNKIKNHYSFSETLGLKQDLIIIYDWDDKLHSHIIEEEHGFKILKDMKYEKMKNFGLEMKIKYNTILNVVK